jgi:hypothetical protein
MPLWRSHNGRPSAIEIAVCDYEGVRPFRRGTFQAVSYKDLGIYGIWPDMVGLFSLRRMGAAAKILAASALLIGP